MPYIFGAEYKFSLFETDLLKIAFYDYCRYADMRMIIGLKISEMWHLLGESLAYIFRFKRGQQCNDCLVIWASRRLFCHNNNSNNNKCINRMIDLSD